MGILFILSIDIWILNLNFKSKLMQSWGLGHSGPSVVTVFTKLVVVEAKLFVGSSQLMLNLSCQI